MRYKLLTLIRRKLASWSGQNAKQDDDISHRKDRVEIRARQLPTSTHRSTQRYYSLYGEKEKKNLKNKFNWNSRAKKEKQNLELNF